MSPSPIFLRHCAVGGGGGGRPFVKLSLGYGLVSCDRTESWFLVGLLQRLTCVDPLRKSKVGEAILSGIHFWLFAKAQCSSSRWNINNYFLHYESLLFHSHWIKRKNTRLAALKTIPPIIKIYCLIVNSQVFMCIVRGGVSSLCMCGPPCPLPIL